MTLKSNLIVSGIQWLIKCAFCRQTVFHPFSSLFISKSCLSPQIKLMINETKNTSANEWRFHEGCEKSPSAVILAFFTGTSSLRNNYTHFNHKFKSMIMMPVRLCFEIRIFYHLVIQRKKITAIGLNSDFFPPYFDGTLFVYIALCK